MKKLMGLTVVGLSALTLSSCTMTKKGVVQEYLDAVADLQMGKDVDKDKICKKIAEDTTASQETCKLAFAADGFFSGEVHKVKYKVVNFESTEDGDKFNVTFDVEEKIKQNDGDDWEESTTEDGNMTLVKDGMSYKIDFSFLG